MKQLKAVATNLAMGLGLVYLLFLWGPIESLFPSSFMTLLRQGIVICFGICVLISPESIVKASERMVPRIIAILTMIFTKKKDNENLG